MLVHGMRGIHEERFLAIIVSLSLSLSSLQIGFKISTPSTRYRVDIFRMGWYRGAGARRVATVRPSVRLPQVQPPCVEVNATRLVDCGTWGVSASWRVPDDAVSGL